MRVLGDVRERLGDQVVRGRLDRVGQPLVRDLVDLDDHRRAARQRLDRRTRQFAQRGALDPHQGGEVGRSAEAPAAGDAHQVHPALGIVGLEGRDQRGDVDPFRQARGQGLVVQRIGAGEQDGLQKPQRLARIDRLGLRRLVRLRRRQALLLGLVGDHRGHHVGRVIGRHGTVRRRR